MYAIFIPTQSLIDRLRGAAAVAVFPVVVGCLIWLGVVLVDLIQASSVHLVPVGPPQIRTCSDCSTAPGAPGTYRLQLPPWASVASLSVKPPTLQSP